jgi:hypothetical protein
MTVGIPYSNQVPGMVAWLVHTLKAQCNKQQEMTQQITGTHKE